MLLSYLSVLLVDCNVVLSFYISFNVDYILFAIVLFILYVSRLGYLVMRQKGTIEIE